METLPEQVIRRLRNPTLSVRTGIWLAPIETIGAEADAAARLALDASDICQSLLAGTIPGSRFLNFHHSNISKVLDEIAQDRSGSDCRLVYNLDIVMAYFRPNERTELWEHIHRGLTHRTVALLFLLPITAQSLYPPAFLLHELESVGRLAR